MQSVQNKKDQNLVKWIANEDFCFTIKANHSGGDGRYPCLSPTLKKNNPKVMLFVLKLLPSMAQLAINHEIMIKAVNVPVLAEKHQRGVNDGHQTILE